MDSTHISEKEKYETMWTEIPAYRNFSPAMSIIEESIGYCSDYSVRSVLDAGCGTGRATKAFIDAGIDAVGVDITIKAVDRDIHDNHIGQFFEASLWELPSDWGVFDCVFCVDVMEHIPPVKIGCTLSELARMCGKLAIFKIALLEDGFGKEIRKRLHMSLFTADSWEMMLSYRFKNIRRIEDTPGCVTFLCEPKDKNNISTPLKETADQ